MVEAFDNISDKDLSLLHTEVLIFAIEKKIDLCDGICLCFKNPETVLKGFSGVCLGCKEKRILVAFRNIRTKVFFDSWKKVVKVKRPISPNSITQFQSVFNNKEHDKIGNKLIGKKSKRKRKRKR